LPVKVLLKPGDQPAKHTNGMRKPARVAQQAIEGKSNEQGKYHFFVIYQNFAENQTYRLSTKHYLTNGPILIVASLFSCSSFGIKWACLKTGTLPYILSKVECALRHPQSIFT
tara:strand:+ start:11183 stop:11521 length:339 start_codon:yes stop_codon:yes gene_type:complete